MIKILANDGMDKGAAEALQALGFDVDLNKYEGDALVQKIKEIDAIIIRSATKIRKPLIDEAVAGGQLKLIIRAGVGIDNIDHAYAKEQGIEVRNTPNSSSDSVAELALAHMFSIARFVGISNHTMRIGEWNKKAYKGIELSGKTLGIVGFGRIGHALAKKALAFGMKVQFNDHHQFEDENGFHQVDLDTLIKTSDIISLHIPKTKDGKAVFGAKEMEMMKDNVILINTARGGVIDEDDLITYLDNGKIYGAGLDVFEEEPLNNDKIRNHPKISLTPHIGAATKEAQVRIGEETIAIIKEKFI